LGDALKYLVWLLKAALFFTLFAFALNNQAPVNLHLFFGHSWKAPWVLVLLVVLLMGVLLGVLVMLPLWMNARKRARQAEHPRGFEAPIPVNSASKPPH
jgi:uncharacterized integral membrane protein